MLTLLPLRVQHNQLLHSHWWNGKHVQDGGQAKQTINHSSPRSSNSAHFPAFFWLVFVFHCYKSGQIRTQECFWSLKNSCIIASQHNFSFPFRSQSFFLRSVGIKFIATFCAFSVLGIYLLSARS
jgi:hypothetical protein